jgi:hypothetical protein
VIINTSREVLEGIVETVSTLQAIGNAVGNAIGSALLYAFKAYRAHLDPSNMVLSGLNTPGLMDVRALTLYLWAKFDTDPDTFVKQTGMTLSGFNVPQALLAALAQELRDGIKAKAQVDFELTAEYLGTLTPIDFVSLLRIFGLATYKRDPADIASDP